MPLASWRGPGRAAPRFMGNPPWREGVCGGARPPLEVVVFFPLFCNGGGPPFSFFFMDVGLYDPRMAPSPPRERRWPSYRTYAKMFIKVRSLPKIGFLPPGVPPSGSVFAMGPGVLNPLLSPRLPKEGGPGERAGSPPSRQSAPWAPNPAPGVSVRAPGRPWRGLGAILDRWGVATPGAPGAMVLGDYPFADGPHPRRPGPRGISGSGLHEDPPGSRWGAPGFQDGGPRGAGISTRGGTLIPRGPPPAAPSGAPTSTIMPGVGGSGGGLLEATIGGAGKKQRNNLPRGKWG